MNQRVERKEQHHQTPSNDHAHTADPRAKTPDSTAPDSTAPELAKPAAHSGHALGKGPFSAEQKRILAVILVPAFMSLLAVSIVNVILPSIGSSLHTGTSGLQWVVSGYALVFGVLLVPSGRAGDVWGRGKLFLYGLAAFGLGSLLSGLATSILVLNAARLLMGIGSGLLNPQVTGMIQQYFQGQHRGRAFGAFGAVVGISVAIGPIIGGALIGLLGTEMGWRWAFLINVPIALIAIIAAKRFLPRSAWHVYQRPSTTHTTAANGSPAEPKAVPVPAKHHADFDPIGMLLLVIAILLIMVPFMEASLLGWWTILVFIAGLGTLATWVKWEQRYAAKGSSPMVDIGLLATKSFANGALLIGLFFLAYTSVWLLLAQYLQLGLGYSALIAGFLGLPSALLSAIAAPIAGRHVHRLGRILVVWGLIVVIVGLLASIAVVILHDTHGVSEWWLLLTLGITGFGQGFVVSPNQALTLTDVPLHYAGSAGGVLQTGQRIGTSLGIAIITSVAFALANTRGWGTGMAAGLGLVVLFVGAALLVAFVDLRREQHA